MNAFYILINKEYLMKENSCFLFSQIKSLADTLCTLVFFKKEIELEECGDENCKLLLNWFNNKKLEFILLGLLR